MQKNLITLIAASCSALTGVAAAFVGTGQVYETSDMRYEILDFDQHTLSLISPVGKTDFVELPANVSVSGTYNIGGNNVTFDGAPFTVVQIGDNAFVSQPDLYFVRIPESVTSIGNNAFKDCVVLGQINFPPALEYIGDHAFQGCRGIKKIALPETVRSLGEGAFEDMAALEKAILLSEVTEIKANTFRNCKALEQVYLPQQLVSIGDNAFYRTDALDEIVFPATLESIGQHAFHGESGSKYGLRHLKLPAGLKHLGTGAFYNSSIITADLGESLEEIPQETFMRCRDLKEVKFPASLKRIGKSAFEDCAGNASRSMGAINIPDGVEEIGERAFIDSDILSFSTGESVSSLPAGACGTPRVVHIGSNVQSIDVAAFDLSDLKLIICDAATPPALSASYNLTPQQSEQLTVIVPDGSSERYTYHPRWRDFNIVEASKSVVSVNLDGSVPLAQAIYTEGGIMPSRVTDLTVSGTLSDADLRIIRENMTSLCRLDISGTDMTDVPASAFADLRSLEHIVLPSGLRTIGNSAFQNCSLMAMEELPDGITSIGDYAFSNCSRITISRLPNALTKTGYMAFGDCVSIKSITAGPNLIDMGQSTFSSCDLLEYADLSLSRLTTLRSCSFYINENLQTLLLPSTLEAIDYRALAITGLKTIDLPGNVSSFGEGAFYQSDLRAITIGEGLKSFDKEIFAECRKLVAVNLPSTLGSVGSGVFQSASRLSAISCRAIEAPAAATGAFDGVLTQRCVLTVPTVSFFSYLNAPQWGKFGNIVNSIEVTMPGNIDATILDEEEYQEIVEEENLQQQIEENAGDYKGENAPHRIAMRAAREKSRTALTDGSQYGKLFGGATIGTSEEGKGHRVFIHPHDPSDEFRVFVNGVDVTAQMEDNSLLLPAGTAGSLEIKSSLSGVDNINDDADASGVCTVYTLAGVRVFHGDVSVAESTLAAGIYIVKYPTGHTEKITVK